MFSCRGALLPMLLLVGSHAGCENSGAGDDGFNGFTDASVDANVLGPVDAGPADAPGPGCGDGTVDVGEACDDGDRDSLDGCSADCEVEHGWDCTTDSPSACTSTCGDGLIAAGAEQCDDADTDPLDGCDGACAVEPGFSCTGEPSVCTEGCGDGMKTDAEGCDDGDNDPGDGCSAACEVEFGWDCTGTMPSVCDTTCGDGRVAEGVEDCDDGDTDPLDGCDGACAVETGWDCTGVEPSTCIEVPDPGCDLSGTWIMRQITFSDADNGLNTASAWFFYEVQQTGKDLVVAEGLNCGVEVSGGSGLSRVVVSMTPDTVRGMIDRLGGTGRAGRYESDGAGGCTLSFEDMAFVRGATIEFYGELKPGYETMDPTTEQLFVHELPAPGSDEAVYDGGGTLVSPGWEDWEPDGNPGVRFVVDVFLFGGSRHSVQRELISYGGTTPADATEFTVGVSFPSQEEIVHQSDNDFLASVATLNRTADHRIVFEKVPASYRVGGADGDFETCLKIQADLPHSDEVANP